MDRREWLGRLLHTVSKSICSTDVRELCSGLIIVAIDSSLQPQLIDAPLVFDHLHRLQASSSILKRATS